MEGIERREGTPSMALVEASEADIATLIEIEESVPKTKVYSPMLSEKAWRQELSECTVYFIMKDGVPVGSIAYEVKDADHVYISGIIVKPEFQGQGLATFAIKDILTKHAEAARIDLVTHPENPALELYESLGFVVETRKENYYGDGEPRLVLAITRERAN